MGKMRNIAKVLKVFAKILSIMALVGGILFVVTGILVLFFGDGIFTESEMIVMLGDAEFVIAPEHVPQSYSMKTAACVQLFSASVVAFFAAYMLRTVKKVFEPMGQGNPFDEAVSLNLKKFGVTTIIFGVLYQVAFFVANAFVMTTADFTTLFTSEKIVSCNIEYQFNIDFIFVALVAFMLSYIFKYGAELQLQSDETL